MEAPTLEEIQGTVMEIAEPTIEQMAEELRPLVVSNEEGTPVKPVRKRKKKEPPQEVPSVRVKVYVDENDNVKVECDRELPSFDEVLAQFSRKDMAYVNSTCSKYDSFERNIRRTYRLSYQDWADAIGAAIIVKEVNSRPCQYANKGLVDGAYLAMGEQLFRLSPVEVISTNKALVAAKARIEEKNRLAGKKIIEDATVAAKAIIDSAMKVKADYNLLLREQKRKALAPRWVVDAGLTHRRKIEMWQILCSFNFRLDFLEYYFHDSEGTRKKYHSPLLPVPPKDVYFWVPIFQKGGYSLTSLLLEEREDILPHMSRSGFCMSIGDAPEKIDSLVSLNRLISGVSRVTRGIRMDSLLQDTSVWINGLAKHFPPNMLEVLKSGNNPDRIMRRLIEMEPEKVSVVGQEESFTA
jgi:hypothetical protein